MTTIEHIEKAWLPTRILSDAAKELAKDVKGTGLGDELEDSSRKLDNISNDVVNSLSWYDGDKKFYLVDVSKDKWEKAKIKEIDSLEGVDVKYIYSNGMNNDEQDALEGAKNVIGKEGTVIIEHNQTHGLILDGIEAAAGWLGMVTKTDYQTANFYMTDNNKDTERLKVIHSQANIVEKHSSRIIKYQDGSLDNINIYSIGSPQNEETMQEAIEGSGQKFIGMDNNAWDPIRFLGNNKATNFPDNYIIKSHETEAYKEITEKKIKEFEKINTGKE